MRIMFVGDINLGEYYTSFGHGPATYLKTGDVFSSVQSILSQADIVAGNLEAALTTHNFDPNEPESVVLRGSPQHAPLLYDAGFRILQVANNHTVQHGKEAFDETVSALRNAGICPIGISNDDVTIVEADGQRVGFLAASDVPDNTDKGQNSYQRLDEDFINRAKSAVSKVDHLFVMFHWGLESSTTPMDYQRKLTTELLQAGVRGVIGSHPHLFYEVWREGNGIAAPSLGNFVFDLCWDERLLKSGILDIEIRGNQLKSQVWPVSLTNSGALPVPNGPAQELMPAINLYDLGSDMSGEQKRKLMYFFTHFFQGNQQLKLKFIIRKLLKPVLG